ncbi:MAG: phosphopentomutase [Clostridiales bacterium]|nr:phosphopentomutase [Clostridiales bacterium]
MKRVAIIVLDSVGIGELPDAAKYGDEGSNTLVNIKKEYPEFSVPNMAELGLGNIEGEDICLLGKTDSPKGCYAKMSEASNGKDTTTGHWEISGIVTENPFPTFTETGFPKEVMDKFEKAIGRKTLGNISASGTAIINELGDEHVKTGYPIIYTSADSVFQIACHEDVIPVDELYKMCETAREILVGDYAVARVIARPFIGNGNGNYTRTERRKDFSLAPTSETILDLLKAEGKSVVAIGKIEDIFEHRGMTVTDHTTNNHDGIEKTIEYLKKDFEGLLFTNLVDTDMIYGHRNDVKGYAEAVMYFDSKLPEIKSAMKDDDILIITADHGCDPTTPSTDHSREFVPLLVYGKNIKEGVNLGVRKQFSDIAATVAEYLGINETFGAESFLKDVIK